MLKKKISQSILQNILCWSPLVQVLTSLILLVNDHNKIIVMMDDDDSDNEGDEDK